MSCYLIKALLWNMTDMSLIDVLILEWRNKKFLVMGLLQDKVKLMEKLYSLFLKILQFLEVHLVKLLQRKFVKSWIKLF